MEIIEAIRSRRSIRGFKPDPVPRKVLEEILEASLWAPSARNTQSWEFAILVVGDSTTDLSLFKLFPNSVLIPNPKLPTQERDLLQNAARYISDYPYGDGFVEVVRHVYNVRAYGV